jgi:hypothetical protein
LDAMFRNLRMKEQYWLKQLITIDQFPGTEHSEVIVEIAKR